MKKTFLSFALKAFVLSALLTGCNDNPSENAPQLTLEQQYQNSIVDAMITEPNEVSTNLIAIQESNTKLKWKTGSNGEKRVLVVAWTKFINSYPVGDTVSNSWGQVWVTAVPEVQDWFKKNYPSNGNITLRGEQLFGLPANRGYTHFVEMWVKPEDLFRPSPDAEVSDSKAELDFPQNTPQEHRDWINDNIIFSYYPMRYPWTRLGYTYDWGNSQNEVGLSEFVLKKSSSIVVEKVTENASYLTK